MPATRFSERTDFFSSTATVIAQLESVRRIANEITLAAANAKAVAARAGNNAAGFVPITNFIDEMGRETRRLVDAVNRDAQAVVRGMLDEQRLLDGLARLRGGLDQLEHPSQHLDEVLEKMERDYTEVRETNEREVSRLCDQLLTINGYARAARIMSTRSRVEATIAGDYRVSLESVANTVDGAAEQIREAVMTSRGLLRIVN